MAIAVAVKEVGRPSSRFILRTLNPSSTPLVLQPREDGKPWGRWDLDWAFKKGQDSETLWVREDI